MILVSAERMSAELRLSMGLTIRRMRARQRTLMLSPRVISEGIFKVSSISARFSESHIGEQESSPRAEILGEAEPLGSGGCVTQ